MLRDMFFFFVFFRFWALGTHDCGTSTLECRMFVLQRELGWIEVQGSLRGGVLCRVVRGTVDNINPALPIMRNIPYFS